MTSTNEDDALAVIGLIFAINTKKKNERRKRKTWCKDWLMRRNRCTHINLLQELVVKQADCCNYLQMSEALYKKLLLLVSPLIEKKNTVMRIAISPQERLTATLQFLATGCSYECLKYSTAISPQALGRIIPETCEAIYKVLRKDYLQFPDSAEKWKEISKLFEERWNFPHCIGAIGGKHIDVVPPADSGSYYYNYKGKHSIVLLAVVDARYRFLLVDFGTNGGVLDGDVLQNTTFYELMQHGQVNIPQPRNITDNFKHVPYVYIADDAFPLRETLLKPFQEDRLDSADKEVFNYRLSRARHVVENSFGILASRFRIYHTQINLEPINIGKVVRATCVLHNFLMEHSPTSYAPANSLYQEDTSNGTIVCTGYDTSQSNMIALDRQNHENINPDAKKVREDFCHYFMNEGKVPWQDQHIFKNLGSKLRKITTLSF